MLSTPIRFSFTSGEVSPWAASRVDMELYARSASCIRNFRITPFGGLCRRPGFQFIRETVSSEKIRLIPFQYSTGDAFVLEFSPRLVRFYTRGAILTREDGPPYELVTPWDDPAALSYQQINDVIFICSGNEMPQRLVRYADRDWRLEEISWKNMPWRYNSLRENKLTFYKTSSQDQNKRDVYQFYCAGMEWSGRFGGSNYLRVSTIAPDENRWVNGGAMADHWISQTNNMDMSTLVINAGTACRYEDGSGYISFYMCTRSYSASKDFKPGFLDPRDYGSHFELGVDVGMVPLRVTKTWEFRSTGTWAGEWLLQKSYDDGVSWTTIRSFFSNSDANFIVNGDESEESCLLRLRLAQSLKGVGMKTVNLRRLSHKVDHTFHVSFVTSDSTQCRASKLDSEPMSLSGETRDWSLGAFGPHYGYPSVMTWHQNRLVFASSWGQPQTVWLSRTDDYYNFRLGSNDDDAMELTLSASSQNKIRWMHSQQKLFLGTSASEWTLDSSDGKALSPSNARFVCHSYQGSSGISPVPMESSLLFVQRGDRKVRELSYRLDSDGYRSNELTIFAEHITSSGLRELCLNKGCESNLWALTASGEAAVMSWIPEQNILAWRRCSLSGDARLLSLASMQNEGRSEELWAAVARGTGANLHVTVERLEDSFIWPSADTAVFPEQTPVYLDSHSTRRAVSGALRDLEHLGGLKVTAYPVSDRRRAFSGRVADNGVLTLPEAADGEEWLVGVGYESSVSVSALEQVNDMGCVKNHISTRLHVLHSDCSVEYSSSPRGPWYSVNSEAALMTSSSEQPEEGSYFTGYFSLNQEAVHRESPGLCVRTSSPHPLNITSIIPVLSTENPHYYSK